MKLSTFECPNCHSKISLPRPKNHLREPEHIKDIWCVECRKITKHIERGVYS